MQYEVEFEMGDGDDEKETGIMIDVSQHSGGMFGANGDFAVIVLGNQKVVTIPLDEVRVVDKAIGQKFQDILDKHEKLDLPVDIVDA